jgi:serine/threonine protein phosphatase PrpC
MPLPEADSSEDTGEFSLPSGTPQSSLTAHFGAASHVGLRRPNNEDHYAVVQRSRSRKILLTNVDTAGLRLPDDEAYAMMVADGMGGCGFGELASELVLRIGWELAGAAPFWVMKFRAGVIDKIHQKIATYGRQIQDELREYAANDPALADMGTTWTCGYLMGRDAIVAHVGDSRAYLFRDRSVRQLTRDHTFAQTLRDAGVPVEETAQYKHLLVNSFGPRSENVKIDIDHVPLEDGDRMLLCSDGLTDMVSDEEITSTLVEIPGAQAACDALIERALHNGGKDNVTVIVADLGDQSG